MPERAGARLPRNQRTCPLWEGYNAFYQRKLPAEITQKTWERFLDPTEPVHALIAEDGGHTLGLVHYLFHRHTALLHDVCYLQDLFTVPSSRGRGIGRALILAVNERAREKGATQVYWQTHETNEAAQLLYRQVAERSGFLVYSKRI